MVENKGLIYQGQLPGFPQNFVLLSVAPVYSWELVPQYEAPVQTAVPQEGLTFGTFLAGIVTIAGGIVLFDPKASKEAKAVAQMALGASVPFLLNKAFELQAWPAQQWN
ncbi:MAG: hypothetical protein WBE37_32145 [Bryobacteraceae bacterium]